jgi:hypothetical protein
VTAKIWLIVTGSKDVDMKTADIEAINPDTGKKLGQVTFNDDHVEGMALEKKEDRLFINLAQSNKLAAVNRKMMKEIPEWPVPPAKANAMIALDEGAKRLCVVCRDPGMDVVDVVMDSDTRAGVSTALAPLPADDVMMDIAAHRLYVPGGEGYIGIYDTSNPDQVKQLAKAPSAPGAKTGPSSSGFKEKMLVAASAGDTKNIAKILTDQLP